MNGDIFIWNMFSLKYLTPDQVEEAETIVMLTEEMDSKDSGLLEEAAGIIKELNKALDLFELTELLSGPYDKEGAVVNITAGAGGTDAQVIENMCDLWCSAFCRALTIEGASTYFYWKMYMVSY